MVYKLLETMNKAIDETLPKGARINAQCKDGQAALHRASWGGCTAVVKVLLEHGMDPKIKDVNGNTALHVAAEKGFESMAEELIERSDLTARSNKGVEPLHHAAWSGSERLVRRLIQRGAKENAEDDQGWSPLHYAAGNGQEKNR